MKILSRPAHVLQFQREPHDQEEPGEDRHDRQQAERDAVGYVSVARPSRTHRTQHRNDKSARLVFGMACETKF